MEGDKLPKTLWRRPRARRRGHFYHPVAAGPGVPADRVKILRDAFSNALKDPELLSKAEKPDSKPTGPPATKSRI